MPLPQRKHPRLKDYDYGQCGCYHITICTQGHRNCLSCIIPPQTITDRAQIQLTHWGNIAEKYIQQIEQIHVGVHVDKYAIMPNHIHVLILLDEQVSTTIPKIVHGFKRMVSREIGQSIWQESFYDVVIRNGVMYQCEWNYIDGNPDKWTELYGCYRDL